MIKIRNRTHILRSLMVLSRLELISYDISKNKTMPAAITAAALFPWHQQIGVL